MVAQLLVCSFLYILTDNFGLVSVKKNKRFVMILKLQCKFILYFFFLISHTAGTDVDVVVCVVVIPVGGTGVPHKSYLEIE